MSEIDDRVRDAGSVPRNAWSETDEGRATRDRAFSPVPETAPRNRRRRWPAPVLVAAALVVTLVAGVALLVERSADDPVSVERPAAPSRVTPTQLPTREQLVNGSWSVIGRLPGGTSDQLAAVWTGKLVLTVDATLGGVKVASFDPRTGRWQALPPPPLSPRSLAELRPDVHWTGSQLIVWGGGSDQGILFDGATYNPATRRWTAIPRAPLTPRRGPTTVWTGAELLVIGGDMCFDTGPPKVHGVVVQVSCALPSPEQQRGAAFDPATGRWRTIAPTPVPLGGESAAVVGSEVMVVEPFTSVAGRSIGTTIAYDPSADRWRTVSEGEDERGIGAAPTLLGDDLVTFAYNGFNPVVSANRLDLATGTWTPFGRVDAELISCWPKTTVVGQDVVMACSGRWMWLVPGSGAEPWVALPDPPVAGSAGALLWTGRELVVPIGGELALYTPSKPTATSAPTLHQITHGSWKTLRNPMLAALRDPVSVWTGSRLLVWSNATGWGVAFDPRSERWSAIAHSDLVDPDGQAPIWVDGRMVVWAGATPTGSLDPPAPGGAYDPEQRRWTPIAPPPVRPHPQGQTLSVATDDSLVVIGAQTTCAGNEDCDTAYFAGAEYQPSTDTWRELPPWPQRSATPRAAAWDGDRVVVLTNASTAWALDPDRGTWTPLSNVPFQYGIEFAAAFPNQLVWVGFPTSSSPPGGVGPGVTWRALGLARRESDWTDRGPGFDVEVLSPSTATRVGPFVAVLGAGPEWPSAVLDVERGAWHTMPSSRGSTLVPARAGGAAWTGREIVVLQHRSGGAKTGYVFTYDLAVYTPGV